MKCGNCGQGNEYGAEICAHCGSTLALTEYYRRKGFVVKKDPPKKEKDDAWDQDILTAGYVKKKRQPAPETREPRRQPATSKTGTGPARDSKAPASRNRTSSGTKETKTSRQKTPATGRTKPATPADGRKSTATRSAKTASADRKKTPAASNPQPKKIPKSKAYNHTTKILSLAEQDVKKKSGKDKKKTEKKTRKKSRAIPILVIVLLAVVAIGIFIGTMQFSVGEGRYTTVAQDFVRAVVLNDEDALGELIHSQMHGTLRPGSYENAERCDTKIVESETCDPEALGQELRERYGITEPLTNAYEICVGCTVYGETTYAGTMDLTVAEIGGKVYVVKAENMTNPG